MATLRGTLCYFGSTVDALTFATTPIVWLLQYTCMHGRPNQ